MGLRISLSFIFVLIVVNKCIESTFEDFGTHVKVDSRSDSDYNECLNRSLTVPKKVRAESYLITEGTTLTLPCGNLCLDPSKSAENLWKLRPLMTLKIIAVELNKTRFKINRDLSLQIEESRTEDTGTYFCFDQFNLMAIYDIHVVTDEPIRTVIIEKNSSHTLLDVTYLTGNNLKLVSQWTKWSKCNRCDRIGIRKKMGICKLLKIVPNDPITPNDIPLLSNGFVDRGLPCRSYLLPQVIANISIIKERKSELMISFCKVKCEPIIRVAEDQMILMDQEYINELQNQFKTLTLAKRKMIISTVGDRIVMSCSKYHSDKYYQWTNTSFTNSNHTFAINPLRVHKRTKGRVKIDFMNNLHILNVQLSDEAIYSCWDHKRLITTTKLTVNPLPPAVIYSFISLIFTHFFTYYLLFIMLMLGFSLWKNQSLRTMR